MKHLRGGTIHSLTGWDIGQFDQTDWIPWDTGDKAKAKSSPSPTASTSLSSKPTPDTRGGPHEHTHPEFLYVVNGTLRTQGQKMSAGDAYAASPGSTHNDFTVDTDHTYLLIFKL